MRARSAAAAAALTAAAAVVGNGCVGKDSLTWFRGLRAPSWQLPMPAFVGVAAGYYAILGYLLARGIDRSEAARTAWAVAVLVGNEAWNAVLFGRRSPRLAFVALLGFCVPLAGLQSAVWADPRSRWLLLPYSAYVVGYDLPWSYRLWRLNPG